MATSFKRAADDIKQVTENYRELNGVMQETVGIVRMGVSAGGGSGGGGGKSFGSAGGGGRAFNQPHQPTEIWNKPAPMTLMVNHMVAMARATERLAGAIERGGGGADTGTELRRQCLV